MNVMSIRIDKHLAAWLIASIAFGCNAPETEQPSALTAPAAPPGPPGPILQTKASADAANEQSGQIVPSPTAAVANLPAVPEVAQSGDQAASQDSKSQDPAKGLSKKPVKDKDNKFQVIPSSTVLRGCVADKEGKDSNANRPKKKLGIRNSVKIFKKGGSIMVRHNISHPCCLKAKVDTTMAGSTVKVNERLSGTPCKCMCDSTLTTDIPVRPGSYKVVVDLNLQGTAKKVGEEKISI